MEELGLCEALGKTPSPYCALRFPISQPITNPITAAAPPVIHSLVFPRAVMIGLFTGSTLA